MVLSPLGGEIRATVKAKTQTEKQKPVQGKNIGCTYLERELYWMRSLFSVVLGLGRPLMYRGRSRQCCIVNHAAAVSNQSRPLASRGEQSLLS